MVLGIRKARAMRALNTSAAVCPGANVSVAEGDGRAVLMDLQSGRYYGLDNVGISIWKLVLSQKTPEEIFLAIENEYDAPAARLREDATRFLSSLLDLGLVDQ